MNAYSKAMAHCVPPVDLEQRLAQRVLEAAPAENKRVIRPMTLARRVLLAAVLALALSVSVGAAVLVNWDSIFADRFGEEAASLPVTRTAFQKVGVTSVCDDVALTVREALGDSKTVYIILDYRLPETADRELVRRAWDEDGSTLGLIDVQYFHTGDWDWETLKAADGEKWEGLDWADSGVRFEQLCGRSSLWKHNFVYQTGGASSSLGEQGYDPETGTLTYLLSLSMYETDKSLLEQPLTLLVAPPTIMVDGTEKPLADHPALISFQPEYTAVARTGEARGEENGYFISAELSPFTISVSYYGSEYRSIEELREEIVLVLSDNSLLPARGLSMSYTGKESFNEKFEKGQVRYSARFKDILDAGAVTAIRVGEVEIPLSDGA